MRILVELKNTNTKGFNGEPIFETSNGPYKYATFFDDLVLGCSVEVIGWCSYDGEPIEAIDSNKFDIIGGS